MVKDNEYEFIIMELRDIRHKLDLVSQKVTENEITLKMMLKIVKVVAIGLGATLGINLSGAI